MPENRIPTLSRPMIARDLILSTQAAQRIHRRGLGQALSALHAIDGGLRARLDPASADQLEADALEGIKTLEAAFTDTLFRGSKGQPAEVDVQAPSYSHPLRVTLSGSSPNALRLIDLVSTFDRRVMALDQAWFEGSISSRVRADRTLEGSRRLLRLMRRLVALARRVRIETYARPAIVSPTEEPSATQGSGRVPSAEALVDARPAPPEWSEGASGDPAMSATPDTPGSGDLSGG